MSKRSKHIELIEQAADLIESSSEAVPVTAGVVLASGFARLLQRLKVSEPYHGTHDVEPNEEGLPSRVEPDPDAPKQLKIDHMVPFGIVSAYRKQYSKKANRKRSAMLLRHINAVLGDPGAYKLIGYWAEKNPEAGDMSYKEALEKGLVMDPSHEESFLIIKPEHMEYEHFEASMIKLGKATGGGEAPRGDPRKEDQLEDDADTQDTVLVCDGTDVFLIEPRTHAKFKIGHGFAASVIAKAYSRMRNKPNIPFVFAGTQQPADIGGNYLMSLVGLKFFSDVTVAEFKSSVTYATYFS